jgi:O-antigen/teichoic acid export membrane protein
MVKNIFANVCRGSTSALVVLILPPFLARILSKDEYSTWLLILQLSTYVSLLDFGIQTAVGRYVAHHNELGETRERDGIVSTALAILIISSILTIFGVLFFAYQLPNIFLDMPVAIHQDAQLSLICLGISLAVALPFNVFSGIFIGIQRYDIPAWIIGVSKLVGGILVILAANLSHSILMMAIVMGITNIGGGLWQFLAYKKVANEIKISQHNLSINYAREIFLYCLSLSIWTISMMLITGFDTTIIAYFDYQSVIYYSLAATLVTFVAGIHAAVITVIMPKASAIGARKDPEALGQLLLLTTRYGIINLILTSLPLLTGAKLLLTIWVGTSYASNTSTLLQILIVSNFIRYVGAPYSTIAIAVGEQRKIILSPLLEGTVNLIMSIVFTAYYGAIGVAIGTLCGSFISVIMLFIYNIPRTTSIQVKHRMPLIRNICIPIASVLPIILIWYAYSCFESSLSMDLLFLILSNGMSWVLLWRYALLHSERVTLKSYMHNAVKPFLLNK